MTFSTTNCTKCHLLYQMPTLAPNATEVRGPINEIILIKQGLGKLAGRLLLQKGLRFCQKRVFQGGDAVCTTSPRLRSRTIP